MDEHQPEQQSPPPDSPPAQPDTTPGAADGSAPVDPAEAFALVEIEYRGQRWNVPKDRGQWDMNVQFEFEEGRKFVGFFTLLGGSPDNVPAIRAQVYALARTQAEVNEFIDHVAAVCAKECIG